MMTHFNRFAHMMDEEYAAVEANEAVTLVVFLHQRFARQKQVSLTAGTLEGASYVFTQPIRLLLALSACLDHCLQRALAEEGIALLPAQVDTEVSFQFLITRKEEARSARSQPVEALPDLGSVLGDLGAQLQPLDKHGVVGFSLVLPMTRETG
jgi:hypothetical protein